MNNREKEAINILRRTIEFDKKHRIITDYEQKPLLRDSIEEVLNLIEKQQERIEECYHKGVIDGRISMRYYIQDKIREYFEQDIAFKKRLQREKQKIDKYNKGKFDTIENVLEFLHVNIEEENS